MVADDQMKLAEFLRLLIDRIEVAAGPDRELDAQIAIAIGWTEVHASPLLPAFRGGRRPDGTSHWEHVPGFTASLDAAVTLIPARFGWCIGSDGMAWVGRKDLLKDGLLSAQEGATPALALCAAFIRAIAAEASLAQ